MKNREKEGHGVKYCMVSNICVMIVSMILFIAYETRLNELNLILENYKVQIDTMKDQLNNYESNCTIMETIEDLTKANNELTVLWGIGKYYKKIRHSR